MARNKRKRSGGDKEPPASADPSRKRPKTRGSDASISKGGAAQASTPGGAPATVTLEAKPEIGTVLCLQTMVWIQVN